MAARPGGGAARSICGHTYPALSARRRCLAGATTHRSAGAMRREHEYESVALHRLVGFYFYICGFGLYETEEGRLHSYLTDLWGAAFRHERQYPKRFARLLLRRQAFSVGARPAFADRGCFQWQAPSCRSISLSAIIMVSIVGCCQTPSNRSRSTQILPGGGCFLPRPALWLRPHSPSGGYGFPSQWLRFAWVENPYDTRERLASPTPSCWCYRNRHCLRPIPDFSVGRGGVYCFSDSTKRRKKLDGVPNILPRAGKPS